MNQKFGFGEYLAFSRRERIGILVLIFLLLLVYAFPYFSGKPGMMPEITADSTVMAYLLSSPEPPEREMDATWGELQFERRKPAGAYIPTGSLFPFDPNTLDEKGWKKLGIRDRTIQTILNFVAKGGRFRKPEDLAKIYGLRKKDFERLRSYIQILPGERHISPGKAGKDESESRRSPPGRWDGLKVGKIDINQADTSAFISLPGIGSKLAARIVTFREKLGGFYSIQQVGEVYGLADSTFQKLKTFLKLEMVEVRKFDINEVEQDVLKSHPYFRNNISAAIIAYRKQHGEFSSVDDLKKLRAISPEVYLKIAPYCEVK